MGVVIVHDIKTTHAHLTQYQKSQMCGCISIMLIINPHPTNLALYFTM